MSADARDGDGVLPDVLASGLDVVFCGSAAGRVAALKGAYYAGRGNRFWPTLAAVGLTPRELAPEEFASVTAYGIGLTDLNKRQSGSDTELSAARDDPDAVRRKILRYRPRALAFVGKSPAAGFLHRDRRKTGLLRYGRQPGKVGETVLFVLPSTSQAGTKYWDEQPWRDLAAFVRAGPGRAR